MVFTCPFSISAFPRLASTAHRLLFGCPSRDLVGDLPSFRSTDSDTRGDSVIKRASGCPTLWVEVLVPIRFRTTRASGEVSPLNSAGSADNRQDLLSGSAGRCCSINPRPVPRILTRARSSFVSTRDKTRPGISGTALGFHSEHDPPSCSTFPYFPSSPLTTSVSQPPSESFPLFL